MMNVIDDVDDECDVQEVDDVDDEYDVDDVEWSWCRWCWWCKGCRRCCVDEVKSWNWQQFFGKNPSQELSGTTWSQVQLHVGPGCYSILQLQRCVSMPQCALLLYPLASLSRHFRTTCHYTGKCDAKESKQMEVRRSSTKTSPNIRSSHWLSPHCLGSISVCANKTKNVFYLNLFPRPLGALSIAFRFMSSSRSKRAERGTSFWVFSANSFNARSPCRQKGAKFSELWLFTAPKMTIYSGYAKSFRAFTSLTNRVHKNIARTYGQLTRASAIFDLAFAFPFATFATLLTWLALFPLVAALDFAFAFPVAPLAAATGFREAFLKTSASCRIQT